MSRGLLRAVTRPGRAHHGHMVSEAQGHAYHPALKSYRPKRQETPSFSLHPLPCVETLRSDELYPQDLKGRRRPRSLGSFWLGKKQHHRHSDRKSSAAPWTMSHVSSSITSATLWQ